MNRQTKRTMRLAAQGASALAMAAVLGAMLASSCVYDTPAPDCDDRHQRCSDGPSTDTPDAGTPDADASDADTPDADTPEPTCVPRDSTGGVEETCGVFVSASRAGSEGAGTKSRPFGSLQEGINLAQQNETGRVYICAG